MKNKNTKSMGEFIFENAFYAVLALIWFRLIFRVLPDMTFSQSKWILRGMMLVCVSIGVLLTWKRRRNSLSVMINILFPLELYALVAFWREIRTLSIVLLVISIILCVAYIYLIFSYKIPQRKDPRIVLKRRAVRSALGARTIVVVVMAALIIPLGGNVLFNNSIFSSNQKATRGTDSNEYTIANNIEVVSNLREEVWETLSIEEKMYTLQTIANIESHYLGLPHELNLQIESLDENVLAHYVDSTHSISLNINYFDDTAHEILDSLCHEAYHAFQHRLVEAYDSVDPEYQNLMIFNNAEQFKEEFQHYTRGQDDFFEYFLQGCEETARVYSASAVQDYYRKIDLYSATLEDNT